MSSMASRGTGPFPPISHPDGNTSVVLLSLQLSELPLNVFGTMVPTRIFFLVSARFSQTKGV